MFNNKTLLITGGTGSFGRHFLFFVLEKFPKIKKIIILSRDELKQYDLENKIDKQHIQKLRFFIGDVRDKERLITAFQNVDYVVHAAALKQVPKAEYNPGEYIKTNITGSQNVIDAAIANSVKKIVSISTDKAAAPINLYGATKLCSDKLFISANNIIGSRDIKFSIVRYGNVLGSRGSILPFFLKQKNSDYFPVTNEKMTRFNITLKEACKMVLWTFENLKGGEIFVPKIPSFKIIDLAKAIDPKKKIKYIGIRPGEKIHEEMITSSDGNNTVDLNNKYYAILNNSNKKLLSSYSSAKKVKENFSYSSGNNNKFLNINEIKKLVKDYQKKYIN
ncbi:UDP-N-acetylglucosamine 4,6-dehydratase (inverting) [Candidatus Pelagibacter sp.]|nr:UDP-N-acetylglucosamine 4,6-dehydratase (inverting) [Candidatus Pelagibacter sp.]